MKKVAIVGAASLTGDRLIKILNKHPETDVVLATSETFANKEIKSMAIKYSSLNVNDINGYDVVFSCLEHGKSMEYLPKVAQQNELVIDLAADFRTPADVFEKWYDLEHQAKDNTPQTYGLSEVFAKEIAESKFIANPGCYPTSVLLALAPILINRINITDISIFSLSGRTGAGREKAKQLKEQGENVFSYKDPYGHPHIGEMEFIGSKLLGKDFKLFLFEPNVLCNVERGIRTTIAAKCELKSDNVLLDIFNEYYNDQPFIDVKLISDGSQITLQDNVKTNKCSIGLRYDKQIKRLYIISVIDNLVKGASGQAVQNMNLALGFDQTMGLL